MRMRKKKWALPELEACPWAITGECDRFRGRWRSLFPKDGPLHVELGCGKGVSTCEMAFAERNVNFVAIDVNSDVLGVARRNIAARYGEESVDNILLAVKECAYIEKTFAPDDRVERIYISFCNPWAQRDRHKKRRLTHPRQLMQYRTFLQDGCDIYFKTDDDILFEDSLVYFDLCGFEIAYLTKDLHASGFAPNYLSEHEIKYTQLGVPIKFGIFRKQSAGPDFDPTRYRLTPGARARTLEKLGWTPVARPDPA